jgi:hypothetical protein
MGLVTYFNLTNRHQAIVKTHFLQKTGIVDGSWQMRNDAKSYKMQTPTFLIDGIYKSMEGPKASRFIQLSQNKKLLWITGFHVKAIDDGSLKTISNDFVCHMNIDIDESQYYTHFNLQDRIGKQYPRLTSLSNGLENFSFPDGFGVPILGNDFLNVTSQSLNMNIEKISKKIKHEISIDYKNEPFQKPLLSKTIYIQLPFNEKDPFKTPLDPASNQCIPIETKNHTYTDANGHKLSGHWVIPVGKKLYRSSITSQLAIKDSLRLHFSAPHVHAFATNIAIYDKTAKKTIISCAVTNFKDKIGLQNIETFSSKTGIWLYENHEYECVLSTNNTSATLQDMMGSMFLFFYDQELDSKLK